MEGLYCMPEAAWPALPSHLLVLNAREAILALAPMLEALAQRCGQHGAMHWLLYFLDESVTKVAAIFSPARSVTRSCDDQTAGAPASSETSGPMLLNPWQPERLA